MGWFIVKTFNSRKEATTYANKLKVKYRKQGHGKSMAQHGSYSIKVVKYNNKYEVQERA